MQPHLGESNTEGRCPYHDLEAWGFTHVTEAILEGDFSSGLRAVSRLRGIELPLVHKYNSPEDKAKIHYISRHLIRDLWEFATPRYKELIGEDGRFDIGKAKTKLGLVIT
ncbi:MAG: hypothetical protein AB7H97_02080, partial [Pseudobdellovibrionaceae bacterium]